MTERTQGIINDAMNSSADKSYRSINEGVDQSRGLLNDSGQFDRGLSYDPMASAIKQRYSGEYNLNRQRLDNQTRQQSREVLFKKLETATRLAGEEAQLNFQKEMMKYKQKMAKRAQRNMVIGQVLGLGGAAVGAMAGGPGGAMMGYSAGSAAGTAGAEMSGG